MSKSSNSKFYYVFIVDMTAEVKIILDKCEETEGHNQLSKEMITLVSGTRMSM